ncbi:MAG: CRTAC1 family protein [Acidobacteriota bacterium]|nr:CRTAC1 family protein [Acidobacteriota bacterium]MDH3528372.1 CRTAC1 family protein [Acidobacteriota bacterium]
MIVKKFVTAFILIFLLTLQTAWSQSDDGCGNRRIPQLVDIYKESGVRFVHTSAPEKKYIVESMSGGVLLIDFDRDGWQDIYFTNAPTVEMALKKEKSKSLLYRNNRDGTFSDVTDKAGVGFPCFAMGGAVGDFNNDGFPDIYVTCLGTNVLYMNNGDETFKDVTKNAGVGDDRWSAGAAFGDIDGDGFQDLVVANYVDFDLNDLPGFGSLPTCKYRGVDVQCGPRGLKGAGDSVFLNNGDGTFSDITKQAGLVDPSGYYGMQPVFSDFANTGKQDVYIANDSTPNFFYQNKGAGKFEEIGLLSGTGVSGDGSEQGSMGVAVGDYLHTGRFAIYVTNFADEYNVLYRNNGEYDFSDVSFAAKVAQQSRPYVGWGTGFVDLDNDSWLDLFVVNGHVYPQMNEISSGPSYEQGKMLFINKGDGSFCDATEKGGAALSELRVSRGAAFGDLDNDGNMDIVVEDLDSSPMILKNKGDGKNHWIKLELSAREGSPLAIGARVTVTTGNIVQNEEIRSGASYLSQNDLRLHFGLGSATKVDLIEIRWPSGKKEVLKDIAADKIYAVSQGKGIVPFESIRPTRK